MVKSYDPKKVIVIFGGVPISGYADGTFVEVAPNSGDGFTKQVGADGEVARAQSSDNTHTVTITLMQSSASNDYLSTIRKEDRMTGRAIHDLSIRDNNGESVGFWKEAWIHGDPTWGYGKDLTERQWTIDTGQIAEGELDGIPAFSEEEA